MAKPGLIASNVGDEVRTGSDTDRAIVQSPHHTTQVVLGGVAVTALAILIFFFHLGVYGLWEPDESRYAEIAREMLILHDFVVPHLNYVPYIEKPPLLYWLTAFAMRLFGINEFAARFVNASAAIIGVLAVYYFSLRAFSLRHAIGAAAILATSALYAEMGQVLTTDMLLAASITIALFALFLHWREGGRWWWIAYIAMGLAVLTKGPIGVAIPIVVVILFLAYEGDLRGALRRFQVVPGLVLTTAITAPWFIAISLRQPDFFHFYFVGEYLQRFFDASYSHGQPFYYYVPIILGGALPWTLVAIFIPWRSLQPDPARRFCLIAAATIVLIFSVASAKLIPYILPAMAPLAIVIADGVLGPTSRRDGAESDQEILPASGRLAACGPLIGLAGLAVVGAAACANRFASANPSMVQPELYGAGTIMLVAGAICYIFLSRQRLFAGLVTIAIASTAILIVASYGRIRVEATRSYAQLAREIARRAPDSPLICYPRYIQSLPFYARRRVILIGPKTELDYGSTHAPDGAAFFFSRRPDLLRLWNATPAPVLILDRGALPPLASSLGAYRVIAEDEKKLAIMRSQSPASPKAP
jgi:4-amino-4-deoxy-L-arabinose transferase-like glycosyltransferase